MTWDDLRVLVEAHFVLKMTSMPAWAVIVFLSFSRLDVFLLLSAASA